jgi:hypothetical protein
MLEYSPERLVAQRFAFNEAQRTGFAVSDGFGDVWYPLTERQRKYRVEFVPGDRDPGLSYDSKLLHSYGG